MPVAQLWIVRRKIGMRAFLKLSTVAMAFFVSGCGTHQHITSKGIDWTKRAEEISVGMTRAEVQHILPVWNGPSGALLSATVLMTDNGSGQAEVYWVSKDWRVCVFYDDVAGMEFVKKPVEIERVRYVSANNAPNTALEPTPPAP